MILFRACSVLLLCHYAFVSYACGAPPSTQPVDGLRDNTPQVFALKGARIIPAPGESLKNGVIVVREGIIASVGEEFEIPDDARVIQLDDKVIYSGLIDACSEQAVDIAAIKSGTPHWNPDIRPQLNVAEQFSIDKSLNEKLRKQGITARLITPVGGILKGTSAVVTTGDQENSQAIVKRTVGQHVRLTVSPGRGRDQYPNSPMGAIALARQTMLDAEWYRDAWKAYRADRSLPTPEENDSFRVLYEWKDRGGLFIVAASNELFVLRADRWAREFGLDIIIRGSGKEYRRLDAIRALGRAIIVPLNFPKPPNVATREAAMNVTLEELMHWDIAPENPGRLDRAGIRIALTSHGLKDKENFLESVRKAVQRGLSADSALKALTVTPAELFGVADRLGTIKSGNLANLVVCDGDLFDDDTKVLETWVNGKRFELHREPLFNLTGTWRIEIRGNKKNPEHIFVDLNGEGKKLAGSVRAAKKESEDDKQTKVAHFGSQDARLGFTFDGQNFDHKGTIQVSAVVETDESNKTTWLGSIVWPNGDRDEISAKRIETRDKDVKQKEETDPDSEDPDAPQKREQEAGVSFVVNYPLGAFGRETEPEQADSLLLKNATVWTCADNGVIKNASLLIGQGKIIAVGKKIKAPESTKVVDLKGRHITPGIIDCHSHMATDGGVNESTQAITAEVRIGDFIDSDDVTIYRQLAGGVTCSNILHGSANPIGGQNQVIKLRWGALPKNMKFTAAPQGIKFALGENVKQSNWGDDYKTRYPQTRMGVDQIIRDEFEAASVYRIRWKDWHANHSGLPPRRDLELEAIGEILQGDRWIHCHSYRQDEILALIRTLDKYEVTIGTFQHILEGYKVADAMAKHGAMGSSFSDWWAYKFEVYDAIPYNGALMHFAGVNVSFNSDDRELGRHLNQEAAKAVKYGGVPPSEALKFVTLNPAMQLRIDKQVGSLESGKDADFVVWSGRPLSNFSRAEQTWIDGRKYFDRDEDRKLREQSYKLRNELVQKILASGDAMRKPGDKDVDPAELWPRHDEFCHGHGHDE